MNNTDRATAGPGSDGLASAQSAQVSPSSGQDDPGRAGKVGHYTRGRERTVGRAWVRTELRVRNTETGQDLSGSVSVCRALGNMNMANGSPDGDMAQLLIICGSRGLMGYDYKYV